MAEKDEHRRRERQRKKNQNENERRTKEIKKEGKRERAGEEIVAKKE